MKFIDYDEDFSPLVSKEQALVVARQFEELPDPGTENRDRFFVDYLRDENGESRYPLVPGLRDGKPKLFLTPSDDYDIHVMALNITIGDTLVNHSRFGNVVLTADFRVVMTDEEDSSSEIAVGQTGGQVLLSAGAFEGYGYADNSFELSNHFSTTDAQTILIPVWKLFPGTDGFVIPRASLNSRISIFFQSDLSGLHAFSSRVRAFGFKRSPA